MFQLLSTFVHFASGIGALEICLLASLSALATFGLLYVIRDRHVASPQLWRARAGEARAFAQGMEDRQAMESMMRVAEEYDFLAGRAEDGRKAA